MRRFSTILSAVSTIAIAGSALAQTGTLDQQSPMSNASYNLDASSLTWQQQVRVGVAGQLEGFELTIQGSAGAQFNARVRVGDGWNTSEILFDELITKQNEGNELMFIDVTSANIVLDVDDTFVIETQGNDTGAGLLGNYVDPVNGPPLYPENLYLNGPGCFSNCGWRHGFNTYMLEGGGGPALALEGSCPGNMTVSVSGATPGGNVAFIRAFGTGSCAIPPGNPCAGTELGLSCNGAALLGLDRADDQGNASLSGNAPAAACGRVFVQAIDLDTCATTNVEGL